MWLPALLLVAALALVLSGLRQGGGPAARIARAIGGASSARPRAAAGWAAGIALSYGATSLVALALIGRLDALAHLPAEFLPAATAFGLTGAMTRQGLIETIGAIGGGMLLGVFFVKIGARRGWRQFGPRYRSPAMVQGRDEIGAALLLAAAAGIAEEAFYRLLVPLLVTLVFGSALAGFAAALALFALAHRYQGRGGMLAVTLVGVVLTWLYLATGQLWLVMLVHFLVDANSLVVRPWLERR